MELSKLTGYSFITMVQFCNDMNRYQNETYFNKFESILSQTIILVAKKLYPDSNLEWLVQIEPYKLRLLFMSWSKVKSFSRRKDFVSKMVQLPIEHYNILKDIKNHIHINEDDKYCFYLHLDNELSNEIKPQLILT